MQSEDAKIEAAQRDLAAFDHLYLDYADSVFRYLFSRTGIASDAEELTAQTFLAALEALPRYRHKGHFAAWLFSIARNKSMDYFRRNRADSPLDLAEQIPADVDLAAQNLETERVTQLRNVLMKLPETESELLRMRYVAGLSFQDMAALLQRKPAAVKKALYRLQARLQAQLEDQDE